MRHQPEFRYGLAVAALLGLLLACAQPKEPKNHVHWDDISHGGHIRKNTPYKQSGFGDCDPKDLVNFTCE